MKEKSMMETTAICPVSHVTVLEKRQSYRVNRRFSTRRRPEELVRDLLRAHSGE